MALEQVLSLIIQQTGIEDLVGKFETLAKSTDDNALSTSNDAIATAQDTKARLQSVAAIDAQAQAVAKANLVSAQNLGGGGAGSAEQLALADATKVAKQAAADAAVASRTLTVEQKAAALAADGLAASAAGEAGALESVGAASETAGAGLTAAFVAAAPLIAAAALFKVVDSGVKSFEALTSTVTIFQQITGATSQQASLLVGQIDGLGINTDTASTAFQRFGATIGTGKDTLSQYGIAIATNAQGNTDLIGTFNNLRTAYQDSADAAQKDAIAKQLAARGGAALLPLLNATDATLKQLNTDTANRGEIFSSADQTAGYNLQLATAALSEAFKGFEVELARGVIPELTDLASGLTTVIEDAGKLQKAVSDNSFFSGLEKGLFPIEALTDAFGKNTTAKNQNAAADAASHTAAVQAEADTEQNTTETNNLISATESLVSAKRGEQTAETDLATSKAAYNTAAAAQNDLVTAGITGFQEYTTAMTDFTNAEKAVTTAQTDLATAQTDLTKAEQPATALQLAEANSKLAESYDAISLAADDVNTAQTTLNEALAYSSGATVNEIQRDRDELQAAKDKAAQAPLDFQQAGTDLTTLKQQGSAEDPNVIAAEAKVVAAHQSVSDAVAAEQAAYTKVTLARADYVKAVQTGAAALATASDDIVTKTEAVETASLDTKDAQDKLNTDLASSTPAAIAAAESYLKGFPSYYTALTGAANDAALAADGVNTAIQGVQKSADALAKANSTLANSVPGHPGKGLPVPGAPGVAAGVDTNQTPLDLGIGTAGGGVGARAAGGPVQPGGTYLVGEKGPELLKMGADAGNVTSSNKLAKGIADNITVNTKSAAPEMSKMPPAPRAAGGPTDAYGTYLVGENGPELLKMGAQAGAVIPHNDGGQPAVPVIGSLTVNTMTASSAADIAREVAWHLGTVAPRVRTAA